MTSYYANLELESWQVRQANYQHELEVYNETKARDDAADAQAIAAWETAHDAWIAAHAAWVANPGDPPTPEPFEPLQSPPQPRAPAPTPPDPAQLVTYDARLVDETEELETATGPALILPGRTVLTGGGVSFALGDAELAAGYVDASTVTP